VEVAAVVDFVVVVVVVAADFVEEIAVEAVEEAVVVDLEDEEVNLEFKDLK